MDITFEISKDSDTPGRFFQRKPKRYAIDEMLTPSQKQCTQKRIILNSRRTEQRKSQYFQNMIKEQNKKMFISTFIKKLKRTIVRQQPVDHQSLYIHQKSRKFLNGLYISPLLQLIFSILTILQICFLLIVISLSTVFNTVYYSNFYVTALTLGFSFHVLDMVKSFVSVKNQDGKRFDKLNDIVLIYIQNQGFPDCLLMIAYLAQFLFFDTTLTHITRYIFLLKIIPLLKKLEFFQYQIIQNVYWQQVWQLIKLFLVNYIFAHFLALVLISMARMSEDQNWMHFRNIAGKNEGEQYVWAYYWATTIMLTVGFGDIAPVTTSQALCMIFIQTISCILLAYNINNVGEIISRIRSYSVLQQTNLKTFRNLTSSNIIPSQLSHRITNYIKESVEMKRKSNINEQNKFISTLPNSFRQDLLKECNKKIFTDLLFFKNLSEKILLEMAIQIERKLTHPEEVIHTRKDQLDVLIFNAGEVAYTYYRPSNRALYSNGKIVQKHMIQHDEFKLLSLDFLFNAFFPFNVKCIDYTIVYKMTQKALVQVLKDNPYDYEYFCMMKDKDKLLLNEFQIYKCELCEKEKHSLDKCPRLHYIPLKQHIIHKFLNNNISTELMIRLRNPRMSKTFYKPFIDKKIIKEDLLRKRVEQRDLMNRSFAPKSLVFIERQQQNPDEITGNIFGFNTSQDDDTIEGGHHLQEHSVYLQAAEKLKDEMSKVINLQQQKEMMWQIEVDSIQDFKYYFRKYNPQKINLSLKRKSSRRRRKAKGGSLRAIF